MTMEGAAVWARTQEIIKDELANEQTYNIWFGPIKCASLSTGKSMVLEVQGLAMVMVLRHGSQFEAEARAPQHQQQHEEHRQREEHDVEVVVGDGQGLVDVPGSGQPGRRDDRPSCCAEKMSRTACCSSELTPNVASRVSEQPAMPEAHDAALDEHADRPGDGEGHRDGDEDGGADVLRHELLRHQWRRHRAS